MFNAPNAAGITGRATSMTMTSPSDPVTIVNNQYNADGTLNQARVKPTERWLRCGERLAESAHGAGVHPVRVLSEAGLLK